MKPEQPAGLQKLIIELEPGAQVLVLLDSVETTVKWCAQNPAPDLFFMDIHLADGLSFEIFEQVENKIPVIFTTAFDEYSTKGI